MEACRSCLGAAGHVVRVAEPDRPGGRRTAGTEPEQPVERQAGLLSAQVEKRSVESRARRLLAGRQALLDLVAGPRIVADHGGGVLEPRTSGLRRLAVAGDRGRLAPARKVAVPKLHLHDVGGVLALARDVERLRELERRDAGGELHRADRMPVSV